MPKILALIILFLSSIVDIILALFFKKNLDSYLKSKTAKKSFFQALKVDNCLPTKHLPCSKTLKATLIQKNQAIKLCSEL